MKISKLVRLFIILFAAFFSVTVVLTLAARQMNSNVVEVLRSQAELKSFGLQLQETFDFLVQQAQNYAIYGEEKSIEAYRNEVGILKNREKAIEGLKASGAAQDELALTLKAMELSNELVRLDSLAFDKYDMENMDVVLNAQGIIFGTEYEENRRLIAETMFPRKLYT